MHRQLSTQGTPQAFSSHRKTRSLLPSYSRSPIDPNEWFHLAGWIYPRFIPCNVYSQISGVSLSVEK
ncbi:hypothetical protein QCA50_008815 [Cerrena zonata]|uniref:Uncharacterized protein n=1 Tax=Cerrena zonata TaxID=2478898 RepID=A0AAW0GDA7_9APHY